MSISMEERLKRRKLDALKRGVHRVTGGEALPVAMHVVGIGRAGANVIAEILRRLEPGAGKLNALAIDIGEGDLAELRAVAAGIGPERANVTIISLPVPDRAALIASVANYPEYLRLEYPRYVWNAHYQPWLPETVAMAAPGGHVRRAVAKAIYGAEFYSGSRRLERALRVFAAEVDANVSQPVIPIIFGMGGGTGSGIAADLARHLSSGLLGRRALVAGIGIAPCDGDAAEHVGGNLFPILSELDCLGDEGKNRGIVMSCGELFRNPYTAGFLLVPLQPAWEVTRDLAAAQRRVDAEIATLLTTRGGANLWETLRLLNWVAAPSTQHSAARTPWGPKWIHMLGYADVASGLGPALRQQLGLLPGYTPEYIEMRVADPAAPAAVALAEAMQAAMMPDVPPSLVDGGRSGSVQFILPSISKTDLSLYAACRSAYRELSDEDRLLDHALLLEQGVLLCEKSSRLPGMAGASLWGGESWIAVPFSDLYGDEADTKWAEAPVPHSTAA